MFVYPRTYDVIVIGAGHAGVEAGSRRELRLDHHEDRSAVDSE